MGALPWTLRTSGNSSRPAMPKVITSESSPLPKSVKVVEEPRRGSLDDILKSTATEEEDNTNPTI